jgi:hypothetical protein
MTNFLDGNRLPRFPIRNVPDPVFPQRFGGTTGDRVTLEEAAFRIAHLQEPFPPPGATDRRL